KLKKARKEEKELGKENYEKKQKEVWTRMAKSHQKSEEKK
ncbi:20689_t:CDS:1, partial [Entrophospora sp. SA101]